MTHSLIFYGSFILMETKTSRKKKLHKSISLFYVIDWNKYLIPQNSDRIMAPIYWLCVHVKHRYINQSINTDNSDLNFLCILDILSTWYNLFLLFQPLHYRGQTKDKTRKVFDLIIDLHKSEVGCKMIIKKLDQEVTTVGAIMRKWKKYKVTLGLELHSKSWFVGWGSSWEKWWISPKLHRSLLLIWKHLGLWSPRTPLITNYSSVSWNLAAPGRSSCSRKYMYRHILRLPAKI